MNHQNTGPLRARHPEDDPFPVSGRSQPRPAPVPEGFAHDMRFGGGLGVRVSCKPCDWTTSIEPGHDLPDLIRLYAQHAGLAAATALVAETMTQLAGELVTS